MKILISVENFNPPKGGAEHSLITLAKKLAEKYEVYVIQPGRNNEVKYLDQIKVIVKKTPVFFSRWLIRSYPMLKALYWKKVLEKEISEIEPNLILTQLNFAPPSIDIAVKCQIPSILFIRSYEHFCPIGFVNGTNCDKNCNNCIPLRSKPHHLFINKWLGWNRAAIQNADLVIANSNFVANITKKWYGIEPKVLYPTIDAAKYLCARNSKEYITIIKPTKRKGSEIFLKIAESLPERKFLAVGGDKSVMDEKVIKAHPNVKFLGWTNEIKNIYSSTKILLAPVEWPEPFGRTVIETGINGIPSITSNCGGLPEAVADGGILIDDIHNVEEWIKAINLLDNEKLYNQLSRKAVEHAEKFSFNDNFERFKKIIEKELDIYI